MKILPHLGRRNLLGRHQESGFRLLDSAKRLIEPVQFYFVLERFVAQATFSAADPLSIETIQLRMDPTDAEVILRKDPFDKSSFPVTLLDGDKQLPGRIKTSGSASVNMEKRSFTIKLAKGLKWHGQSRISLNGMGSDPTMMRNRFVWETYHAIGEVGPQTAYYRMQLNGKPMGLYLQIEWIDGKLFDKNGLGGDGELFHRKDSFFCGDLNKKSDYDIEDCWYKFSAQPDDYSALTELVKNIDTTPIDKFDEFLDKNFDVDSVINWLVVNVLVADGDTYNKNYFLYHSNLQGQGHVDADAVALEGFVPAFELAVGLGVVGTGPHVREAHETAELLEAAARPNWAHLRERIGEADAELSRAALEALAADERVALEAEAEAAVSRQRGHVEGGSLAHSQRRYLVRRARERAGLPPPLSLD